MAKKAHKRKNTKAKKIINSVSICDALFLFISAFLLIFNILKMNVIPNKYMIYIWIFIFVVLGCLVLLLIPNIKKGIKIFTCVIALLIGSVCTYGFLKVQDTTNFLKKISASDYEVEQYYVIVLKDSEYTKISDIKGEEVGVYKTVSETYEKALDELGNKVDTKIKEYDDIYEIADELLDNKINVIMISDTNKETIEDENSSFSNSIKVIETITVKTELEDLSKDANVTKEAFNIYISGIDTYGPIATKSRSDVNIIMTVNPTTNQIILTSIPRDYYVQLHGTTGLKDKLTHAGVMGINMSIQTIEDLLDIDINYYVRVNFNTLIDLVDVIGGITVDSDISFTSYTIPECKFTKGENSVKGKCALAFSRERYAYTSGDRHRGQNQQQVITKIIEKLTSSKTIINKYSSILSTLEGSFQTNMETDSIYALVKMQLDKMPSWTINNVNLDGTGSMTYTYSYPNQKLYVMVPTESTVTYAKTIIDGILAGKTFNELNS
jgi:LCP family protein required for cell wall assembly